MIRATVSPALGNAAVGFLAELTSVRTAVVAGGLVCVVATLMVAAPSRPCTSNDERTAALDTFLHANNYHRCHTALGGQPPISRVNNPAGQYT
ncbi:hypothetical protein AB0D57_33475 [Streptomyces sp. NPDC048275]|uniref:hypothetical protein n=1 Tax=Streptomyces sp. NPDC048275 TaxID=3155629 RepID=UPI0033C50455